MMKLLTAHYRLRSALFCICALSTAWVSHAADGNAVLLQGAGIAITSSQVQTELQALPLDVRTQLLDNTEQMQQWLDTLYLRKALATAGESLAQKPAVQQKLQQSQETILASAQLQHLEDAAVPRMDLLEAQARVQYKAENERFNSPAQTRASHILIKGSDETARNKAQQLLDQIKAGASFEELARKNSADRGSAARGGSLGSFPAGRMVPAFDAAVQQIQQPGDLSPLIKSQFGYHIIRLDGRQPAQAQSYEEVREQLIAGITQQLRKNTREAELKRLRDAAKGTPEALKAFMNSEKQRGAETSATQQ